MPQLYDNTKGEHCFPLCELKIFFAKRFRESPVNTFLVEHIRVKLSAIPVYTKKTEKAYCFDFLQGLKLIDPLLMQNPEIPDQNAWCFPPGDPDVSHVAQKERGAGSLAHFHVVHKDTEAVVVSFLLLDQLNLVP